jgi:uncharacterized protein
MADVQISVRGKAEVRVPPEWVTVSLTVQAEGSDRAPVLAAVGAAEAAVRAEIGPLFSPEHGPISWWTGDQLRTWSERPWQEPGRRLPPTHYATMEHQVRFVDFTALGEWLARVAVLDGVTVGGLEWGLPAERMDELTERARAEAVNDAQRRAASYAAALGLGAPRPVAVADAGMLGRHFQPEGFERAADLSFSAKGGPGRVDLTTQDVVVTAAVDAQFLAG